MVTVVTWTSLTTTVQSLFFFNITINKCLQIMLFSAYLVYLYKFNKNINVERVSLQYSRKLIRIAIAMGATVGLSFFFGFISVSYPHYRYITFSCAAIFLFIQQAVIMTSFVCTKKMLTIILCTTYFQETN